VNDWMDCCMLVLVLSWETEEEMLEVRVEKKAFPEDGGEFILLMLLFLLAVDGERVCCVESALDAALDVVAAAAADTC